MLTRANILDNSTQITIKKHVVTLLEEHLTRELGAHAYFTVRTAAVASTVEQSATEEGIYYFNFSFFPFLTLCTNYRLEEDMDDSSSTFSDLSVGTSTSDTSTTNKDSVTVEIGVWNYFSFGAKVAQVHLLLHPHRTMCTHVSSGLGRLKYWTTRSEDQVYSGRCSCH